MNQPDKMIESGEDYLPIEVVASAKGGEIRRLYTGVFYFPVVGEHVSLLKPVKIGKTVMDEIEFKEWIVLKRRGNIAVANKWEGK